MAFEQGCLFDDNPEYEQFTAKFEPKKTTDDCYTPPLVYDAIRDWVCKRYDITQETIVRPFYPGGDFERFAYPDGCLVLDNPPFSILSEICKFYLDRGINFFLFAPSLTAFCGRSVVLRMNHIICDADITYENGAVVRTAFVTNLDADTIAETAPDLRNAIADAMAMIKTNTVRQLPKYEYPMHVLTAAMLQKYAHYGVNFSVRRGDCTPVGALDSQRERKKQSLAAACCCRKGLRRKGLRRKWLRRKWLRRKGLRRKWLRRISGRYLIGSCKLSEILGRMVMPIESQAAAQICAGFGAAKVFDWRG